MEYCERDVLERMTILSVIAAHAYSMEMSLTVVDDCNRLVLNSRAERSKLESL